MTPIDPQTCRRALREISEIAAVAVLQDSQMTEQEALQAIAAIADWVIEETPGDHAACADVVRRLDAMTQAVDFDGLGDRDATALFDGVLGLLRSHPGPARSGVRDGGLEAP
jgi:hypothetical protein